MPESVLQRLAREKLASLQKKSAESDEGLASFVVRLNPNFTKPVHLGKVIPHLEAMLKRPVYLAFSAPPRHGKSQLVFNFIVLYLMTYPHRTVAYCSYSASFAESKSRIIRELFQRAGGRLDNDSKAAGEWRTPQGGGLLARGPGGALTGHGIDLLIIDDPLRNRAEAESATIKDNLYDWWTSTALTRLEPGASVCITHTRWTTDDLMGRILESESSSDWIYENMPAIGDDGAALWPERFKLPALEKLRRGVGEYDWASMYMGSPRPHGSAVFQDVHFYDTNPDTDLPKLPKVMTKALGLDLAYTQKTYSDYSVAVVMGLDPTDRKLYILDVIRKQCDATTFTGHIKMARTVYPNSRVFWYVGGVEKGVVPFIRNAGIPLTTEPALTDKFVRAQEVAAAWNRGDILVPASAPWLETFISEIMSFTGVGDAHDDQVDALAAAYAPLAGKKLPRGVGKSPIGLF